jgi:hypothetical protein
MYLVGLERHALWDGEGRLLHSMVLGVYIVYLRLGI